MLRPLLEKYPQHLVVDAGGWSERRPAQRALASRVFLEGMQEIGLQVANVAGRDLLVGPQAFAALRDELGLDFVSANILVDGEPLVHRYRVYERRINGRTLRIGVSGVTVKSRAALENWKDGTTLEFADAVESARTVLEELRAASDVQVLLAELPTTALDELVETHDGYDILVSSLGKLQETTPVGPTPAVLSPGTRGKQLAWINLRAQNEGLEVSSGEVLGLDEKIQDDAEMASRVLQFKERLQRAAEAGDGRVSASEAARTGLQRAEDGATSP